MGNGTNSYDMHEEDERDEEYFREMHLKAAKYFAYVERELTEWKVKKALYMMNYVDSKC